MSNKYWSVLTDNNSKDAANLALGTDTLVFDAEYTIASNLITGVSEISAAKIIVEANGVGDVNTKLTYDEDGDGQDDGATEFSIILTGTTISQLTSSTSTTVGNIRFNDESKLLIGTTTKGDTLTGWFGNDQLLGLAGNDTLNGGAGNDVLNGGTGNDNMTGGLGDDTYYVDSVSDTVTELAGQGTDTVRSNVSYTITSTNVENLTLITGAGNINGTGNAGTNTITGNDGNNKLDGKTVAGITDTLIGGDGDDTYVVPAQDAKNTTIVNITEAANKGNDTVESARTYTLGAELENLTLTGTSNIEGKGNSVANIIIGNSGNNKLDGGTGADKMGGGAGNDTYVFDDAGDTIYVLNSVNQETSGTDTIETTLTTFSIAAAPFTVIDNITLNGGATTSITGNDLSNVIKALNGAADASIKGGKGNDTYYVDTTDTVVESSGQGTDLVISTVTFTLGANVDNLTLSGTGLTGTGNGDANVITDSSTASDQNTLVGKAGNDTYYVVGTGDTVTESSNQGTDVINWYAAAASTFDMSTKALNVENFNITKNASGNHVALNVTGNDSGNTISGNDAINTILGGDGADTITGAGGDDVLKGEAGNDSLNGGTGNDKLTGGLGNDVLILGSSDSDTVFFEDTGDNNGADTISNFSRGASGDILDFNAFIPAGTINLHSTTASNDSAIDGTAVAGEVLLVNDTGTALTNATVASSLIHETGTTDSPFTDSIGDGGTEQYIVISAATTGSARIWFIDSSLDSTPEDISVSDVKLVGTLSGVSDFATLSFDAFNIAG